AARVIKGWGGPRNALSKRAQLLASTASPVSPARLVIAGGSLNVASARFRNHGDFAVCRRSRRGAGILPAPVRLRGVPLRPADARTRRAGRPGAVAVPARRLGAALSRARRHDPAA